MENRSAYISISLQEYEDLKSKWGQAIDSLQSIVKTQSKELEKLREDNSIAFIQLDYERGKVYKEITIMMEHPKFRKIMEEHYKTFNNGK